MVSFLMVMGNDGSSLELIAGEMSSRMVNCLYLLHAIPHDGNVTKDHRQNSRTFWKRAWEPSLFLDFCSPIPRPLSDFYALPSSAGFAGPLTPYP